MVGINALNDIFEKTPNISPAEMLTQMRKKEQTVFSSSAGIMHDSIDMAVCKFTHKTKTLHFSGANLPVVIVSNSPKNEITTTSNKLSNYENSSTYLTQIQGNKNTIGKNLIVEPFTNISVSLEKNDKVYLFSDGYRDQFGGRDGQKFKKKRFLQLLLKIANSPFEEQQEILKQTHLNWMGNQHQIDDITIIGLQPF